MQADGGSHAAIMAHRHRADRAGVPLQDPASSSAQIAQELDLGSDGLLE